MTASRGKTLVARLPSYPEYCRDAARWHDARIATAIVRASDAEGYARADSWSPGLLAPIEVQHISRLMGRSAADLRFRAERHRREGTLGRGTGGGRDRAPVSRARRGVRIRVRGGRCAEARERGRDRTLRRQPQHQLHQRVHLPLHVLRFLQGHARPGAARRSLRGAARRDRAAGRRGVAARSDRSLHAGRHPPFVHRGNLSRNTARGEARGAADSRPRVHAPGSDPRRGDAGPHHPGIPARADRGGTGEPSRHRRGNPRRRGATRDLSRQGHHGRMAVGDGDSARAGTARDRDGHVRPRRAAAPLGAASPAHPGAAGENRRLYRVRPAAVRAHGSAQCTAGDWRARDRPSGKRS